MKMDCPKCHSTLEFGAEWCGQQMRCPYCEETFDVPAIAVSDAPPPEKKRGLKWVYISLVAVILVCLGVGIGLGARILYTKAELAKAGKGSAEKKVDSPGEVLQKIIAAQKELDYDTLANLSHGEWKEKNKRAAEKINEVKSAARNGDKDAQRRLDETKAALENWQVDVKAEEIDGDLAVVYGVRSGHPDGNGLCCDFFEKVDGEWKSISTNDYTKAMRAKYAVPKGLSPSEIVRKWAEAIEAMKTLNFYAAANLSQGKDKEKTLKLALDIIKMKAGAYAGDEKAKKALDELKDKYKKLNVEVKGETVDGDYAVVDVVISGSPDGKNGPDKFYFKKVDGEWKKIKEEEYKRERSYR